MVFYLSFRREVGVYQVENGEEDTIQKEQL